MAMKLVGYSGYRPRAMRQGRAKHEGDRGTKRARLGNARDRWIYKSAKGYKIQPRYGELCHIADQLQKGGK